MSAATQLGLDDPDRGLLAAARRAWRGWAGQHEALGVVAELEDLPAWLTAHPGERSTVLGVLSGLAAQQEGDDVPAAAALAWLLVPGASPHESETRTRQTPQPRTRSALPRMAQRRLTRNRSLRPSSLGLLDNATREPAPAASGQSAMPVRTSERSYVRSSMAKRTPSRPTPDCLVPP